ncbi:7 transmembrane receptor (rhodopsin family) domain-containing protein [Ditylenchus destructor]|uniref:7 transmembrane receptor (Rhodopsin family) domain-containing protein n=1 Tax=Ditylenchus destructor TaxID=166010 RepID=A0AAD4N9I8_9BILA|nr:7 transmembrane receptor (rhodopsin family) domain-containing protein [Ditylenchus destructor]
MQSDFVFMMVHMSVVATLAILGNLFLAFVIWRGNSIAKQKISPVQLLLLHTCTADLLFALLSLGTEMLILNSHPHFYAPECVCKLVRYLQALPMYASAFLLVAISIDRYQAICRPLAHYRSDRYRRPMCLGMVAWVLALLCSLPQIFIWHKPKVTGVQQRFVSETRSIVIDNLVNIINGSTFKTPVEDECKTIYGRESSVLKSAYVIWFNSMAWLLPSIISAVFYCKVCRTVWKSNFNSKCSLDASVQNRAALHNGTQAGTDSDAKVSFLTRDYVNGLRKRSLGFRNQMSEFDRKRIQTVRLTLTIIVCNFFLWSPFCVMNLVLAFAPNLLSPQLSSYIVILGNLNSCVNPWIYILFNRKMVTRALTSIFPKKPKLASIHSSTKQASGAIQLNTTRFSFNSTTHQQQTSTNSAEESSKFVQSHA